MRRFNIIVYEIVFFGKGNDKRKAKEYQHHPDGVMKGNKGNIKSENQSQQSYLVKTAWDKSQKHFDEVDTTFKCAFLVMVSLDHA